MKAVRIPVDRDLPVVLIDVNNGWQAMAKAIGGSCEYIERVKCVLTPTWNLVMVVDEEGIYHEDQKPNYRAGYLYPFSDINGDVLVMAEDWVGDGRDFVDLENPQQALELVRGAVL